jgi:hypothetical protein
MAKSRPNNRPLHRFSRRNSSLKAVWMEKISSDVRTISIWRGVEEREWLSGIDSKRCTYRNIAEFTLIDGTPCP